MRPRLAIAMTYAAILLLAQAPITFQYFYDDTGQLTKVVDSTGIVIEYAYDAVGNMLEVRRSAVAPGALTIFSFTPQSGGPLTKMTIQGQGFSPTPSSNIVKFNSVAATVISASFTTLVVQVPLGALTGSISVSVGANTTSSTTNFTALPIPVITSVSPNGAAPGSAIANFQVAGANLTGGTFSFTPALVPSAITVGTASISAGGTVAALSLKVSGTASGDFILVATNAFGSSSGFGSAANTLRIAIPSEFVTRTFSVLNGVSPAPTQPTQQETLSRLLSVLNGVSPAPTTPITQEASGRLISILNSGLPGSTQPTSMEAVGSLVSILNSSSSAATISAGLRQVLSSGSHPEAGKNGRRVFDLAPYGPDFDGDGIPDLLELLIGTNPYVADSDKDGFPDGLEIALGSDPLDGSSTPVIPAFSDPSGLPIGINNLGEKQGRPRIAK